MDRHRPRIATRNSPERSSVTCFTVLRRQWISHRKMGQPITPALDVGFSPTDVRIPPPRSPGASSRSEEWRWEFAAAPQAEALFLIKQRLRVGHHLEGSASHLR